VEKTIKPEVETSAFVEVFTAVLPFVLLAVLVVLIVFIVYVVKIANRYLANGKIAEQKFKREETDIQEIKKQLDRIEKILNEEK